MARVVDMANPADKQDFLKEILHFLLVLFLWPLHMAGNIAHSLRLRRMEEAMLIEMNKILAEHPETKKALDRLECPESDEDKTDEGNA